VTQPKPTITGTTHTLPFHQLSPRHFERMCLWLVEREGFDRAEHLGAAGNEQGRDIVAWREGQLWAFQCKRVQHFGPKDVLEEVEKVLALPKRQRPARLVFIVTCNVSANTRQQVRERCAEKMECCFWAGTELDEKVKRHPNIFEEFFSLPVISATTDDSVVLPPTLPPEAYHRLVGRFNELEQMISALREPERKPIIAIIGLGGIGKTALAREVAERCRQEKLFACIVWTSFKTEYFVGEGIARTESSGHSFDELLSDIGRKCDRIDIAQMQPDQRRAAVKYLLATNRVLIVIDNVETVPEGEKLVAGLCEILGQSKLLITSRHHVKCERVYTVNLGGFPEDEGVSFLREESKERGIEVVARVPHPTLVEIHQVTGGAPLAMKLVVGQMYRQPMQVVLDVLKQAA
jgi:hypothetical protein